MTTHPKQNEALEIGREVISNRDPNMIRNQRVYVIRGWLNVAGNVISGQNVESIEGYILENFAKKLLTQVVRKKLKTAHFLLQQWRRQRRTTMTAVCKMLMLAFLHKNIKSLCEMVYRPQTTLVRWRTVEWQIIGEERWVLKQKGRRALPEST